MPTKLYWCVAMSTGSITVASF